MITICLDLFYNFLDFDMNLFKARMKMKKENREEDEEMLKNIKCWWFIVRFSSLSMSNHLIF